MADETVDIAIVGGGVSGVYSGWKLKQAHPAKKIVVFERSGHIGGRLLSLQPPGIPNMVAELGGMRILPAVQPLISNLIQDLNKELPADKRIELYKFPVDEDQNIAYLRGIHLRLSDFKSNPDKVPYRLSFLERGKKTGVIMTEAIEQIVPGITKKGLTDTQRREMAQNASFAGRPLYKQGFWNVLMRVISGEAYQFGVDAGGYSTTLSNWNCADAIPWFLSDFGATPEYKGFKKGFQQVPLSVAALFQKAGGDIRTNIELDGFKPSDKGFELQFKDRTIHTATLILAMPRRALDLITPSSPLLQKVPDLIGSVTPRPLFKIFTTYDNPWWLAASQTTPDGSVLPLQSGRTVTDLPVRQTYYWPTDKGDPAESGPAMLMASYDDGANIGFWDGLRPWRKQAWKEGLEVAAPEDPFIGTGEAEEGSEWKKYRASKRMVAEVSRQVRQIHDLNFTPEVRKAAFRDWGEDPFGGGWNSWNIGVKSWEVKKQIIQPIAGQPLFICGEAYSDAQGWVEGALQTADMMLEKLLGKGAHS